MSDNVSDEALQTPLAAIPTPVSAAPAPPARSFVHHARIISVLTLGSRILGVIRESIAALFLGAGLATDAFTFAFAMPNLFRRLLGEGALSVAFVPFYARALKEQERGEAQRFASSAVNFLAVTLLVLTLLGELFLFAIASIFTLRPDHLLAVKLTAIMFPYVLLVCGTAFLGAILQVHRRFAIAAAVPMLLNVALIVSTIAGARLYDTATEDGRIRAIYLISTAVVIAGVLQLVAMLPTLRAVGFRFNFSAGFWTPAIQRMVRLAIPVAIGAGVLQLSTLLDKGIAYFLAEGVDHAGRAITHFTLLGYLIPYPLEHGAAVRLSWAQLLYQFPLGVFAIAVATAIFPTLSDSALDTDRSQFRSALRKGIDVTMWEGLPASIGLMIVALPAVQVIFERGQFTHHDSLLVARSLRFYAIAIWAFSLNQILSRAFYALHDTKTPLVLSILTLAINLLVELPLLWVKNLAESGMAAGTAVSFIIQVLLMLYILRRKIGGLGLEGLGIYIVKISSATALMALACFAITKAPFFPQYYDRSTALVRLSILIATGSVTYIAACALLGVGDLRKLLRK